MRDEGKREDVMPLSTAAKAMLCVCPPALLAGTVATVPSVKRAVHHATAHRTVPKTSRAVPDRPAVAQKVSQQECAPGFGGLPPAAPLLTYAAPIPDEPSGGSAITPQGGGFVPVAGIGIGGSTPVVPGGPGAGGPGTGTPTTPTTPTTPVTPEPVPGAVPEPSTWLMLIGGVGMLGAGLRRRRNAAAKRRAARAGRRGTMRKATLGGALLTSSAAVEAGDMAATVMVKSALASAAGKALLCVCPAAVVAGSVMTVPPLRQAVHAYTSPDGAMPAAIRQFAGIEPCIEPILPPATAPLASTSDVPAIAPTQGSTIAEAAAQPPAGPPADPTV
jgi:hypothetical protein